MGYNRNRGVLVLSDGEWEEMINNGSVVVVRRGFEICVNPRIGCIGEYDITIVNPYETAKPKSLN